MATMRLGGRPSFHDLHLSLPNQQLEDLGDVPGFMI
jgi:hypothetical protein